MFVDIGSAVPRRVTARAVFGFEPGHQVLIGRYRCLLGGCVTGQVSGVYHLGDGQFLLGPAAGVCVGPHSVVRCFVAVAGALVNSHSGLKVPDHLRPPVLLCQHGPEDGQQQRTGGQGRIPPGWDAPPVLLSGQCILQGRPRAAAGCPYAKPPFTSNSEQAVELSQPLRGKFPGRPQG